MKRIDFKTKLGRINAMYYPGNTLIVFLNGFGSFDTYQSFKKVIDELPKKLGFLALDYLNTGFSGKSQRSYIIRDEASELANIINQLNAQNVIIVAHSIAGVYALELMSKINNLQGLIGIEPTTREIILDPPKSEIYLKMAEKENDPQEVQKFIKDKIRKLFSEEDGNNLWQTTLKNSDKFNENDQLAAGNAMNNDVFWKSKIKMIENIPNIIVTETYRHDEYQRSEYVNDKTKIIDLGSFHYIHWEYPKQIAELIKELSVE